MNLARPSEGRNQTGISHEITKLTKRTEGTTETPRVRTGADAEVKPQMNTDEHRFGFYEDNGLRTGENIFAKATILRLCSTDKGEGRSLECNDSSRCFGVRERSSRFSVPPRAAEESKALHLSVSQLVS